MKVIDWINGKTKLNADTMNTFQQNINDELEDYETTTTNKINTGLKKVDDELAKLSGATGMPIGAGCDYYGVTAPSGYMFADGSAISRTNYAELFSIIGTTYGIGDGSTTFNLPDKRERVSVMYKSDSTKGTEGELFNKLGAKGGEDKHTQTLNELVNHSHNIKISTRSASGGTYKDNILQNLSDNSQELSYTSTSNGNGKAFNILQPYLVCNYIIRVK